MLQLGVQLANISPWCSLFKIFNNINPPSEGFTVHGGKCLGLVYKYHGLNANFCWPIFVNVRVQV